MSTDRRQARLARTWWAKWSMGAAVLMLCAATTVAGEDQSAGKKEAEKDVATARAKISGEEIFRREWLANDPRSHGGDGLGPVFNESSCVACHNQGGVGGGGPVDKNVLLMTAALPPLEQLKAQVPQPAGQPTEPQQSDPFASPGGAPNTPPSAGTGRSSSRADRDELLQRIEAQHAAAQQILLQLHPGFRDSSTVVVHRFGIDPQHEDWRNSLGALAPNRGVSSSRQSRTSSSLAALQRSRADTSRGRSRSLEEAALRASRSRAAAENAATEPSASFVPASGAGTGPILQPAVSQPFPIVDRIRAEIETLKQQAGTGGASARDIGSGVVVQISQRNTTALFGTGLIDAIPAAAIEAAAKRQQQESHHVSGRVHRLQDGRIGRFGWKAQEASLYDFTMTACAVEVGLHVPDHPQSPAPYNPDVKPAGFDLTQTETDALVDYLKHLPAPVQRRSSHPEVDRQLDQGAQLFESVGCAACHAKQMGEADGLFSDLLLHDMGPDLGAVGHYGVPSPPPVDPVPLADAKPGEAKPKPVPPTPQEWRTPPLWGVRDSAPYLHDGRASTLQQAIAFHGGEAADARLRFFLEPQERRQKIVAFLKSLVAPETRRGNRN